MDVDEVKDCVVDVDDEEVDDQVELQDAVEELPIFELKDLENMNQNEFIDVIKC